MTAVAIVGIGCRLPGGVTGPGPLWESLLRGQDSIADVPGDRWDADRYYAPEAAPRGRMSARQAGFLDNADGFDAAFFSIPNRVAEQMDPQQRLLLEVCWEALEDAGIVPDTLAGSPTGVYIGACSHDYGELQTSPGEIDGLGPHSATGMYVSILANRLSYMFDLRGPSLTVDTACSSSLTALHLACEGLQHSEASVAVVGGVNLMLTPQGSIALSQASMLSPDARSRAFDASANGYVRGEGAAIVVLKPLHAALADRDRVYAVIRGTAINQDGRTQGMTVPSGTAQVANFRAALAAAGVKPGEVGYVEAHGTGTPVGDPIEANALGEVLIQGRPPGQVAHLGSVKTNVGHLEGGAGVTGLIKAALAVQRRVIPPSLHFTAPNPEIDFDRWQLAVPTTATPWPACYSRAVASVNSFGFGGANANVVLEEPPAAAPGQSRSASPGVLTLNARSEQALATLAASCAGQLEAGPADLEEVAGYLATRRSHHPHRLAVIASDTADAAAKLRRHASQEEPVPGVVTGTAQRSQGRVAFVLGGQGPQWWAMGRVLLETSPVYRATIMECDELARQYLGWSIYEALTAPDPESSRVQQTHCLQPTMFALQVALAELWKSWGITPGGVTGHSMGEIGAAHISGSLDLDSALRVICRRAALQEKADPSGGMMFVGLPGDQTLALCGRYPDALWLSAENSPRSSTLSGRREVLSALAAELAGDGVFTRLLRVNCACHSQDMEPLRDALLEDLAGIHGAPSAIPMYSTVTGSRIEGTELDTGYWWRNFRQPVRFGPAISAMLEAGFDTFVELSPHPVLSNLVKEVVAEAGANALAVSSLVREKDDWESFLGAFAALYAGGREVNWQQRYPSPRPAIDLPVNPWVHQRFWNESPASRGYRAGGQRHPMLKRVDAARPTWEVRWDDHRLTWVHQHNVFGSVLVPGAAYVEAALAAAREQAGDRCALEFVEFERACVLPAGEPVVSRVELDAEQGTFEVYSRQADEQAWARNARGRYHTTPAAAGDGVPGEGTVDLDAVRTRCGIVAHPTEVYGTFRQRGYRYGPAFCGIDRLHAGQRESLARVTVPLVLRKLTSGYGFHPAVLDACFQSALLYPADDKDGQLSLLRCLPTGVDEVRLHRSPGDRMWCYSRMRQLDPSGLCADISIVDDQGRLIAEIIGLRGRVVPQASGDDPGWLGNHLYQLEWRPDGRQARPTAVRSTPGELAERVAPECAGLATRLARDAYAVGYQQRLSALCAAYIARCLQSFGIEPGPGGEWDVAGLPGLLPAYQLAMTGLLRHLADDGAVAEQDGRWRVLRELDTHPQPKWAQALAHHPSCLSELLLLRRTGSRLHDVLTGQVDPLELLFPGGSPEVLEPIYQGSPVARFYNLLAGKVIGLAAASADARRTLRVLEVGAGTGGLTAAVLPALPADRCEYVFTDISPAFFAAARDRFSDQDFVRYQTLDLEKDAAGQGITPGSFDLVLASDVVHATTDLTNTLATLCAALAPGGILALLEATPGSRWGDLTFGLTAGWWQFHDLQVRRDTPLLSAGQWADVLRDAGYDDVVALGDPGHQGPGSQSLLLARAAPAETSASGETAVPGAGADGGPDGEWLILGGEGELGASLARLIEQRGGRAAVAADLDGTRPDVIIDLRGTDAGSTDAGGTDGGHPGQGTAAISAGAGLTQTLRALAQPGEGNLPRLYILTRGAHACRNDAPRPERGTLWGLGLVGGIELPRLGCTMIDLDPVPGPGEADAILAEVLRDGSEQEVLLRGGERFIRRLAAVPPAQVRPGVKAAELAGDQAFALEAVVKGTLDQLRYQAAPRRSPGPGQVEVRVMAAGLNFLDIMTAMGQVPPLEGTACSRLGAECTGLVTRVGEGVTGLQPGDAVMAASSRQGTVASHITLDASAVIAKPEALSFEEAATVPIAFLTAWYALHELARIQPGERVLIHSAAGGVGLAAVQLALLAGAEVFATAGTAEKRELLATLGVRQVMDSRSLTFAAEISAATGGDGVDVAINATTGEFAARTIACLAPYGRFVEIGKRDLLGDRRLGLRPFLRNLAYFSFDLRQLLEDRPQAYHAAMGRLLDLFARGDLRPLPFRVFPPSQARAAFRHLASADHVGKIVLAMDEPGAMAHPAASQAAFRGTWLITGGLGGLGLATAEALADAGVQGLALIGRSGIRDEQARIRVDDLRARGVSVLAEAVDVTSRADLAALIGRIDAEFPPLRGVVHSAMVLEDALLANLDAERLARVLEPKVLGAQNLDELTAGRPLDAFVLFSSATSLLGNAGQASYAGANAFLDHLAEARHARGERGLSVNWGAVSDVGYVARNQAAGLQFAGSGLRSFTSREACEILFTLLSGSLPRAGVLKMDWSGFLRNTTAPRYADLRAEHEDGAAAQELTGTLSQQLRRLPDDAARQRLLIRHLTARVAAVVGVPASDLSDDTPLVDYVDSLLALEISFWIERETGTKVTLMELMRGGSIAQLTADLLRQGAPG